MFDQKLKSALNDALAQLENQKNVLDALNQSTAIIEFSPDGIILSANANFEQTMGYSAEEIIGQHHSMFCLPQFTVSQEYKAFWHVLRTGGIIKDQFRRIAKDGRTVWLEASYNPVHDKQGQVVKVMVFALDVTQEVKLAHEARNIMKAVERSMAVIEFTPEGVILTANANFLGATGYTAEEIIGKHHRIFCPADFVHSPAYEHLWQQLKQGVFVSGRFERLHKSGRPIWLEASYNPIFDDDGVVFKVIKFATDITDQETARQQDLRLVQEAHRLSAASDNASSNGQQVIRDTIQAMSVIADSAGQSARLIEDLEQKTSRITTIVNTIHEIADQTNLLALNAAIEAARAGEQGRGFAVVADEVRKLAERTSTSTKEVTEMIDDIKNGTGSATESIHEMLVKAQKGEEHASEASSSIEQIRNSTSRLADVVNHFSAVQAGANPPNP
ncbi:methyl-accepting chemotaxis protein [Chromobacterium violaceum]|uniref:methyl-accepting chemotaxis protein n=1 Tax=Chromobacterium violaceum TaxID=536 RepID=UPI0009D99EC8|nr:PAS domain-containing methyl-accepting chemotaxis protein [Chromobacterium violaceum]MBX9268638.1 PAS domain-containing methyl-accepting chemotaxis protein [Chromobacterium violaceum]OQS44997.1 chemotaxis protein [Chromobacterium violaceum]OQS48213.1 chemotaxis protein [Chromobacterium violaceum]QRO34843.1 PAS domain S-box protein [Chromobacterium violaceum]QRQ15352.1 PAS domain S-box protein [Chromobacterium violaceum]